MEIKSPISRLSKIDSLDLYNGELLKFVSKYKFAIAFENAVCQDYVTEKLWRPLLVGTVPIYLGSPSVEDWLPNKNSAILAKHFQTPAQLAEFLNKINKNDSLYEKFRKHKYGEIENGFLKNALAKGPFGMTTNRDHPIPAFECFVCQMVYEGVKTREAKSVYDCPRPNPRNSWEHHWRFGDCQSKALVNSVKNNVKLEVDPC
ncbi:alpha-(1,3)-fucosyltransferase 10 [Asbolus verrucosus]|uniref:Fucosyltransferase n=1 Tax=Asbolus verrucosus TaxID=1661398 RepID=A0A482VF01_ASBVE|nr:alpha-(1,3)-fucosyltransferase 10 [Asbolus verrucosus]